MANQGERRLARIYLTLELSASIGIAVVGCLAMAGVGWAPSIFGLQMVAFIGSVPALAGIGLAGWRKGWFGKRRRVAPHFDRRLALAVTVMAGLSIAAVVTSIATGHRGKSHACASQYCDYTYSPTGQVVDVAISRQEYIVDQGGGTVFVASWAAIVNLAALTASCDPQSKRTRMPSESPQPTAHQIP